MAEERSNNFRFLPRYRLLQSAEYTAVFGQRRVLRGSLFDLHFGNSASGAVRLGLVIPKRNAALSVTRNYCKRIAREIFRHRRADLPPLDLVLRLARTTKSTPRDVLGQAVRHDVDKLLGRLPR